MINDISTNIDSTMNKARATADVTRVFARFVAECTQTTPAFATHPDIDGRFKLIGISTTSGAAA